MTARQSDPASRVFPTEHHTHLPFITRWCNYRNLFLSGSVEQGEKRGVDYQRQDMGYFVVVAW
jgi:hypothetical protein